MTKKKISLFKKSKHFACRRGFTLVELLTVMMIMAILIAATLPTMASIIKTRKGYTYIPEAKAVYYALQGYLLEEFSRSGERLDHRKIRMDLMAELGDPDNALTARLEGSYTGGSLSAYNFNLYDGRLNKIRYDINGYRISVVNGTEVEVTLFE